MIKLKNIINESVKVEQHKVITTKDEPVFMTEEQWNAKWDKRDKLHENRPAWMAAIMVGKIIFKIIYAWAEANPQQVRKLKDYVRKLDPTKPFKRP